MLVSSNGAPVIRVGVRAYRGDAAREELLAMRAYKGTTMTTAKKTGLPDVLVYAS